MSGAAPSSPCPSQDGAAFTWILDHIMSYPGSYEIPLRTMYTLNSSPRAQPLPKSLSSPSSPSKSSFDADRAAMAASQFQSHLVSHLAKLPSQPTSLPPSFLINFIRKTFTKDLTLVDFPQSLTALDYLRDLDSRRRREILAAVERLGIERDAQGRPLINDQPEALRSWLSALEKKEKKSEALYSACYVGLRRWVLINEMLLQPYSRANCLAMLNTLYPPSPKVAPTPHITVATLEEHRKSFFKYINGVESIGTHVLDPILQMGRRSERGDSNGWPSIFEQLDHYLRVSSLVIDECTQITLDVLVPAPVVQDDGKRKPRKVDSGVSFTEGDRPVSGSELKEKDRSAGPATIAEHPPLTIQVKSGSKLEKIAREIRRMRERKKSEAGDKGGSSRKTRSAHDLGDSDSSESRSSSEVLGLGARSFMDI